MGTEVFDFSLNALDKVLEELKSARQYIRIALFQIHSEDIFDVLVQKREAGVSVEVFTLPYDSINPDLQSEVIPRFEKLEKIGVKLFFCKWNVGDPERTITAVGRWYSFHGKFMVTERSAIALSANFTLTRELDAIIMFRDDPEKIREFNEKFDELLDLFITRDSGYEGSIRRRVKATGSVDVDSVFMLPRIIESSTHKDNWIRHYPASLCPELVALKDKLYLIPFDVRGQKLFSYK